MWRPFNSTKRFIANIAQIFPSIKNSSVYIILSVWQPPSNSDQSPLISVIHLRHDDGNARLDHPKHRSNPSLKFLYQATRYDSSTSSSLGSSSLSYYSLQYHDHAFVCFKLLPCLSLASDKTSYTHPTKQWNQNPRYNSKICIDRTRYINLLRILHAHTQDMSLI